MQREETMEVDNPDPSQHRGGHLGAMFEYQRRRATDKYTFLVTVYIMRWKTFSKDEHMVMR